MNSKCILLARVSTNLQEIDAQLYELEKKAKNDGYSDIIKIQNFESGLQEENKIEGIQELKNYINTDKSIDCVYVWEISRIARLQKTIYSIITYLQENKIQLIVLNPFVKMLDDNYNMTKDFSIIAELYSQFAEIEVKTFIDRSRRQKKYNSENGKFCGGIKLYGYTVDDNGYYIINKEEADIIKTIYDLYINNDFGYGAIYKILKDKGINISSYKIQKIITESGYTGDISLQTNELRPQLYPQIISKDDYIKAMNKRNNNTKNTVPNYYYAYKLLICPECGHYYRCFDKETYQCWYHSFRNKDYKKCGNKKSISVKLLDFLLYYTVYNTKDGFILGNESIFYKIQENIKQITLDTIILLERKSHIIKIMENNGKINEYIIWGSNMSRKIYKLIDNDNLYDDIKIFNDKKYYNIEG